MAVTLQTDDELDFGSYTPERLPKEDRRSKLIKARQKHPGHIINCCPFGCKEKDLDEHQYCKHLVGFTDPDDKEVYYPVTLRPTRNADGTPGEVKLHPKTGQPMGHRFVDGENPQLVQETDKLVRVTTCYRVYRSTTALTSRQDA